MLPTALTVSIEFAVRFPLIVPEDLISPSQRSPDPVLEMLPTCTIELPGLSRILSTILSLSDPDMLIVIELILTLGASGVILILAELDWHGSAPVKMMSRPFGPLVHVQLTQRKLL